MDILEHAFRLTKNGAKSLVSCIILLNPSDQTKLRKHPYNSDILPPCRPVHS